MFLEIKCILNPLKCIPFKNISEALAPLESPKSVCL